MFQPNRTMPSAPVSLNHESCYAFSNNHGSGKWPLWRLKPSAREPFDTSMIVGGKVMKKCATSSVELLIEFVSYNYTMCDLESYKSSWLNL